MKRLVVPLILLASVVAYAQTSSETKSITTSGNSATFQNPKYATTVAITIFPSGNPTSYTVTTIGCSTGGASCGAVDSYTGSGNTLITRSPSTSQYAYFQIKAVWSGGTNVSIQLTVTLTGNNSTQPSTPIGYISLLLSTGAPTGSCTQNQRAMDISSSPGAEYNCPNGAWNAITGGGGGGGLADPGSNGIVKRTALNITAVAAAADITGLFSGCSGTQYLGADGGCHTAAPAASPSFSGTVTMPDGSTNNSSGYSFAHSLNLPSGSQLNGNAFNLLATLNLTGGPAYVGIDGSNAPTIIAAPAGPTTIANCSSATWASGAFYLVTSASSCTLPAIPSSTSWSSVVQNGSGGSVTITPPAGVTIYSGTSTYCSTSCTATAMTLTSNQQTLFIASGTAYYASAPVTVPTSASWPNAGSCSANQFVDALTNGATPTCAALTAATVGLGNVTNDTQTKASVMPNTAPAAGTVPVGNGSSYSAQQQGVVVDPNDGATSVTIHGDGVGSDRNGIVWLNNGSNAQVASIANPNSTGFGNNYRTTVCNVTPLVSIIYNSGTSGTINGVDKNYAILPGSVSNPYCVDLVIDPVNTTTQWDAIVKGAAFYTHHVLADVTPAGTVTVESLVIPQNGTSTSAPPISLGFDCQIPWKGSGSSPTVTFYVDDVATENPTNLEATSITQSTSGTAVAGGSIVDITTATSAGTTAIAIPVWTAGKYMIAIRGTLELAANTHASTLTFTAIASAGTVSLYRGQSCRYWVLP